MDWMIAFIRQIAVSVCGPTVYGSANGVVVVNFHQHMDKFRQFFSNATNTHPNITFAFEASTVLPSLDVLVKINNIIICTTVCCKPTDRHSYLQYKSNHPIHLKHSLISF